MKTPKQGTFGGMFSVEPVTGSPLTASPVTGATLRDEALERVELAADAAWTKTALSKIRLMPERFTTDDMWLAMQDEPVSTPEPRAMGAVMMQAKRAGWITTTNEWARSTRPCCHARPVRVWRCYLDV